MNRLNHHHLYIFWTLARTGSFTNAAKSLSIAQSAVTSQIKQLEEVLGLSLIDRSNKRKTVLTAEGRRVLEYANSIFEYSQELLNWANKSEQSKINVIRAGAISGLSRNLQFQFFQPIINDHTVKLEITTGDQDNLLRLLKEHSLDLVLSSHNVMYDGNVTYYSHVLTTSPIVFVMKAEKGKKSIPNLKQALSQKKIYIPGQHFEIRPELDAYLERLKCNYQIAGEIDDIALLRIFALRTGSIVALPEMGVRNDIESKKLIVLSQAKNLFQRYYAIAMQKKVPHFEIEKLISAMRK